MDFQEHTHNYVYQLVRNWNTKGKQIFQLTEKEVMDIINTKHPDIHPLNIAPHLVTLMITGMLAKTVRKRMLNKVLTYLFDIGLDYISIDSVIYKMELIDIEQELVRITDTGKEIKHNHIIIEEWFIQQMIEEEYIDVDSEKMICISDKGVMKLKELNYYPEYESKEIKVAGYTRKDGRKVKGYTYKRNVLKNKK